MQASEPINLRNGAQITSRSSGSGDGGTVAVTTPQLTLGDRSEITAATASGDGGNLRLSISEMLQLRRNSLLSAEAGGIGNGGNIQITAPFIVGLSNSDIVANAFQGNGGNIAITTDGIFGLQFRNQLTPDNDITASSQFGVNGSVQIRLLSIDPSNALTTLPVEVMDSSQQMAQTCANVQSSRFVVTGRGGIPENPIHRGEGDRTWADLRDLSGYMAVQTQPTGNATPLDAEQSILEATSFTVNAQGRVALVVPITGSLQNTASVSCSGSTM